jgi:hypothetical protein
MTLILRNRDGQTLRIRDVGSVTYQHLFAILSPLGIAVEIEGGLRGLVQALTTERDP